MLVVLTYDLNDGWGEVTEAAFAGPFFNIVKTTTGQKQAPNTTLFVNGMNPRQAIEAFDQAVARAAAKLGRRIVVQKLFAARAEDWRIRSDAPRTPVR